MTKEEQIEVIKIIAETRRMYLWRAVIYAHSTAAELYRLLDEIYSDGALTELNDDLKNQLAKVSQVHEWLDGEVNRQTP